VNNTPLNRLKPQRCCQSAVMSYEISVILVVCFLPSLCANQQSTAVCLVLDFQKGAFATCNPWLSCSVMTRSMAAFCCLAVLGGVLALDGIGEGHPELDAHWAKEFPRIDTDKSGAVSRDEIMAYLKTGHHIMSKAEKTEVIEEIKEEVAKDFMKRDKDNDGFLSGVERNEGVGSKLRRGGKGKEKMSLEEYIVFKNPAFNSDHTQYIKFLTEDVMDEWDANENKQLDYEEYDQWQDKSRQQIHEWEKTVDEEEGTFTISISTSEDDVQMVKEEDDANFKEADKNSDKALDFDELLAFMTSKGGLVWEAEADEFFMYVDQNRDDKITVEELQDAKYLNPVQTLYAMSHHMARTEM